MDVRVRLVCLTACRRIGFPAKDFYSFIKTDFIVKLYELDNVAANIAGEAVPQIYRRINGK